MNNGHIADLLKEIRWRLIGLDSTLEYMYSALWVDGKNVLNDLKRVADITEVATFSGDEALQAMAEKLRFERRWNEFLFFVLHVLYKGRELEDPYRLEKLYRDGKLPPGAKEVNRNEEKSGGGVGEGTCGT